MITVGSQVRGYTVVRLLGQGGMGKVFLAQHQRIARHVAIKVLLPELSSNQEVIERFFAEAQATSLIKHPGIVEVIDCDVLDDQAFIVMEYLHGESLAGYWARLGGNGKSMNDLPFALAVIAEVAEAVGAAHGAGIIHRDLKPDNIFLCAGPRDTRVTPKVLDFGIAKVAVQGSTSNTRTGVVIGTPTYMSPEQCRESKMVDGRADVYSLGCIFYEALCGRPPFIRDGLGAMIIAHVSEEPDDPRGLVDALPPGVFALLARMLAKDKEQRPESMEVVAAELRRLLDEMGVTAPFGDVLPRRPVERPNVEIDAKLRTPAPPSLKTPRQATTPGGLGGPESNTKPDRPSQVRPGAGAPGGHVAMRTQSTLGGAAGERADADAELLVPRSSSRKWMIPAALVVVGGLAFAGKSLLSRPAETEKPAVAPTTTAAATAPAAPPVAAAPAPAPPPASAGRMTVTVDVRGVPTGAEIFVDGAKAPGLPVEMKRDDRRHHLVVRASGHQERTVEIGADRDQTIDVDLPVLPPTHAKSEKHHATAARETSVAAKPAAVAEKPAPIQPAKAADATTPAKKVPDNHGRRSNYDDM